MSGRRIAIDKVETNVPKMTGEPGRTSWQKAVPAITSASTCVKVPATVTGLMAPERMNGVIMQA